MCVDKAVMAFAGAMVLISLALTEFVSHSWVYLTVFVGANLVQASVTGFCPAAMIFKRLGVKPGKAFN